MKSKPQKSNNLPTQHNKLMNIEPKNSKINFQTTVPNAISNQMHENVFTRKKHDVNQNSIKKQKIQIMIKRGNNVENLHNDGFLGHELQFPKNGYNDVKAEQFIEEKSKHRIQKIFEDKKRRLETERSTNPKKCISEITDKDLHNCEKMQNNSKIRNKKLSKTIEAWSDALIKYQPVAYPVNKRTKCPSDLDNANLLTQNNPVCNIPDKISPESALDNHFVSDMKPGFSDTQNVLLDDSKVFALLNENTIGSEETENDKIKKDPLLRSLFGITKQETQFRSEHVSDGYENGDHGNTIHLKDQRNQIVSLRKRGCLIENDVSTFYTPKEMISDEPPGKKGHNNDHRCVFLSNRHHNKFDKIYSVEKHSNNPESFMNNVEQENLLIHKHSNFSEFHENDMGQENYFHKLKANDQNESTIPMFSNPVHFQKHSKYTLGFDKTVKEDQRFSNHTDLSFDLFLSTTDFDFEPFGEAKTKQIFELIKLKCMISNSYSINFCELRILIFDRENHFPTHLWQEFIRNCRIRRLILSDITNGSCSNTFTLNLEAASIGYHQESIFEPIKNDQEITSDNKKTSENRRKYHNNLRRLKDILEYNVDLHETEVNFIRTRLFDESHLDSFFSSIDFDLFPFNDSKIKEIFHRIRNDCLTHGNYEINFETLRESSIALNNELSNKIWDRLLIACISEKLIFVSFCHRIYQYKFFLNICNKKDVRNIEFRREMVTIRQKQTVVSKNLINNMVYGPELILTNHMPPQQPAIKCLEETMNPGSNHTSTQEPIIDCYEKHITTNLNDIQRVRALDYDDVLFEHFIKSADFDFEPFGIDKTKKIFEIIRSQCKNNGNLKVEFEQLELDHLLFNEEAGLNLAALKEFKKNCLMRELLLCTTCVLTADLLFYVNIKDFKNEIGNSNQSDSVIKGPSKTILLFDEINTKKNNPDMESVSNIDKSSCYKEEMGNMDTSYTDVDLVPKVDIFSDFQEEMGNMDTPCSDMYSVPKVDIYSNFQEEMDSFVALHEPEIKNIKDKVIDKSLLESFFSEINIDFEPLGAIKNIRIFDRIKKNCLSNGNYRINPGILRSTLFMSKKRPPLDVWCEFKRVCVARGLFLVTKCGFTHRYEYFLNVNCSANHGLNSSGLVPIGDRIDAMPLKNSKTSDTENFNFIG